jgi:hypothetical protein
MNKYTAKVASHRVFEDTQSISVLAVCKTENGKLIEDTFVSFYLNLSAPLAKEIMGRTVSEIGFEAAGFSEEPTRKGNRSKNLEPVFALVGLDRNSVQSLLSTRVRQGRQVTDEGAISRNRGIASRAAEWFKGALTKAAE